MSIKEFPLKPSTIETVDMSMYDWLNKSMNLFSTTNKAWRKVPVVWVAGERSFQIKNDRDLRDENGTFILPVITLERTAMTKDMSRKGAIWAALPEMRDMMGGAIEITKQIQQEKTSNFMAALNKRIANKPKYPGEEIPENALLLEDGEFLTSEDLFFILTEDDGQVARKRDYNKGQLYYPNKKYRTVYRHITIPLPIYISTKYEITIKTEFQQQMNELLQPFMTFTGGINRFYVNHDGHRFECFMDKEFSQENTTSDLELKERQFTTKITIETLAYLIGQDKNQNKPKISIRESIVEVKIPKERVIFGDIMKIKQTK